jgi:tungstate transport system substrate-binding protein
MLGGIGSNCRKAELAACPHKESKMQRLMIALLMVFGLALPSAAQERSIIVASTTSTEQSGLFGYILLRFTEKTGIHVNVVAVGTGQALDIGRRGDADVVLVHDKPAEEKFMAEGGGVKRFDVMYNDFVVIGPKNDPAHIAGEKNVLEAFRKIAAAKAPFISRGDRSGTNAAELRYWADAGINPATETGGWYREIGQGMGAALNMASSTNAYVLSDRGTWLSYKNRSELAILVEGDKRLFNQYGVMLVNPAKHPNVKVADGQAFIDWLISADGQKTIAGYKIGGEQLFFPDANGS